jgi:hypothetical protein
MSDSVPSSSIRDQVIAGAKSAPDLIHRAEASDPALAKVLLAKGATSLKTPLGGALTLVVTWAVTHYGLGWDQDTVNMVSGMAALCVGYLIHLLDPRGLPAATPPGQENS